MPLGLSDVDNTSVRNGCIYIFVLPIGVMIHNDFLSQRN